MEIARRAISEEGKGVDGENIQRIRSIIGRYKRHRGRLRTV